MSLNKYLFIVVSMITMTNTFATENDVLSKKSVINGSINLNNEYVIVITDLSNRQGEEYPLASNGKFNVDLELSQPTWFEISFVPAKKDRQLGANFPLYIRPGDKLDLRLNYDNETYLTISKEAKRSDNNALIEYGSFSNRIMRDLFYKRDNREEYANAVNSYLTKAESLATEYKVKNKQVLHYLKLWSYNNYLSVTTTNKQFTIPEELAGEIPSVIDSELMLTFWNGVFNINNFLNSVLKNDRDPLKRIANKIEKLNELFKTDALKSAVVQKDLEGYVTSYKIVDMDSFNADIKRLDSLLSQLQNEQMKTSVLNDFKNLYYTSIGSSIPNVKFKDVSGNEVSLEQFKGKYIYIDLWASWCVPCIKEIPFLHELEKDFKMKNIVFVSISLDNKKNDWLNKVSELKLGGHQWELGESNYDKLINVSGIPHFIIYGPDSKLIQYKAPRPSSSDIRTFFNKI